MANVGKAKHDGLVCCDRPWISVKLSNRIEVNFFLSPLRFSENSISYDKIHIQISWNCVSLDVTDFQFDIPLICSIIELAQNLNRNANNWNQMANCVMCRNAVIFNQIFIWIFVLSAMKNLTNFYSLFSVKKRKNGSEQFEAHWVSVEMAD